MARKVKPKAKAKSKVAKSSSVKLSMNDFIKMLAKTDRDWKLNDTAIRSGNQCPITKVAIDAGGYKSWNAYDNVSDAAKFIGLNMDQSDNIIDTSDCDELHDDQLRRLRLRILRACGLKK